MATPITNFGLVTVSIGYSAGATSIALSTGHGSKLPDTTGGFTFPLIWWNATDFGHPAQDPNVEIVLVTARSGDTLTVTRAQEGTSASAKNTSTKTYFMSLSVTKAMWDALPVARETFQGLQLQTHRDSDVAPNQVELVGVDFIVMNDGTELRNDSDEWSGKLADITVSGAGGLDTGAEASGTLYEIYAIAKEDGTRNLLLTLADTEGTDTNYTAGEDATQGIRSAVDNSTVKVAQGFQLSNSGPCPYIEVKLIKVGTPTGRIWFTIESNSSGKPSGTALATSHAYDVARLSTTATVIRIPMKSSSVLSASTQYHLVAQGSWTISASNYVGWRMDGSAGAYASGSKNLFDSDTSTYTTDTDDDMYFSIARTSENTLTLPTGYTKKCFLGWVYNDGSGNFVPFLQVDRTRRVSSLNSTDCTAGSFSGSAERISLGAQFLPPRKMIKAILGVGGTGTAKCIAAIGDLRATDISSAGDSTGAQSVLHSDLITTQPGGFKEVMVQNHAVMVMGTASASLWVAGWSW